MISYKYVISNSQGLHAHNAMSLSRAASDFKSRITVKGDRGEADCKNVMALLGLCARQGEAVTLEAEGTDEEEAAGFLKALMHTIL